MPPIGRPSGGLVGPVVLPPPQEKKRVKTIPGQDATLNLLTKDKRFAKYRQSLGLIKQKAGRWSVDPADLLLVLAATGIPANDASIDSIGPKLQKFYSDGSPQAWAVARGVDLAFDLYGVRDTITKRAGWTQPYVSKPSQTPVDAAGKSVDTAAARKRITTTDRWVVFDPKRGKVGTVPITSFDQFGNPAGAPKNALTQFGAPITQSQFDKARSDYNDYFQAYAGKPATPVQVASIISKGLSSYAVEQMLSKQPGFRRSRVWAAKAPAIIGYAKSLYGEGWKVDQELVQRAIVGNWDQGTLDRRLKERPEYLRGPQYKQATASLSNVHMKIMGTPAAQDQVNIHEAALEGWSPDQYAAWVRSTDAYRYSPEAKAYSIGIAEALGLVTGSQGLVPVNTPGGAPQPAQENKLPNGARVQGTPTPNVPPPVPAPAAKAKPKPKQPGLQVSVDKRPYG